MSKPTCSAFAVFTHIYDTDALPSRLRYVHRNIERRRKVVGFPPQLPSFRQLLRTFSSCSANVTCNVKLYVYICVDTQSQCVLHEIPMQMLFTSLVSNGIQGNNVLPYVLRFASKSVSTSHWANISRSAFAHCTEWRNHLVIALALFWSERIFNGFFFLGKPTKTTRLALNRDLPQFLRISVFKSSPFHLLSLRKILHVRRFSVLIFLGTWRTYDTHVLLFSLSRNAKFHAWSRNHVLRKCKTECGRLIERNKEKHFQILIQL